MTRLADEQLAELERLEKAATKGPWEARRAGQGSAWVCTFPFPGILSGQQSERDAKLKAALRNAAPELIAMAREAGRLRDALVFVRGLIQGLTPTDRHDDLECWLKTIDAALSAK